MQLFQKPPMLKLFSHYHVPGASVVDLDYCWLGWEEGKLSEVVDLGGEAGEAFGAVGKVDEVADGVDGEEVVDGGLTKGRRREGWAAGCGMGSGGDHLASPLVADTSDQSKHQCETFERAAPGETSAGSLGSLKTEEVLDMIDGVGLLGWNTLACPHHPPPHLPRLPAPHLHHPLGSSWGLSASPGDCSLLKCSGFPVNCLGSSPSHPESIGSRLLTALVMLWDS